jgi:hypothetical protein
MRLRLFTLLMGILVCGPLAGAENTIFVSTAGSDANPGTLTEPVATLHQAQRLAREMWSPQEVRQSPVTIAIRGGFYALSETLIFNQNDSGTLDAPLLIAAYEGESVVLSGGGRLENRTWSTYRDGIYQTDVSDLNLDSIAFDQLFIDDTRQHMARFPNYDADDGWAFGGTSPEATSPERVKTWADPTTGFVHALHAAQWGSHHFRITGVRPSGKLRLEGGWQENRPQNGTHKEFVMVENIFEELDAPGEWFLDRVSKTLYVYPKSEVDLSSATLTYSNLKSLIRLSGTMDDPLRNIHFKGIQFSHTARVFMEPHDDITRGDWAIAQTAAAFVEGGEDCSFRECTFTQLGGTAVYLRHYNRRVDLLNSHIHDIGEAGIVMVGAVDAAFNNQVGYYNNAPWDEMDMTPGPKSPNYPAECRVHNNLMHDLGVVNKQTSAGVFISVAENLLVSHNTIFKCPRSGFTVNDGAFGGHIIEFNDVFATVRETGDHGPFNSWGRDRHWQTRHAGFKKGDQEKCRLLSRLDNHHPTVIRNNRFSHTVGTHSFGIDLDDGSSNYHVYNNLTLGCAFKLREGFYRVVENNILISPFPPGKHVCFEENRDIIRRNIIVNPVDREVFSGIGFRPDGIAQWDYNLYASFAGEPVFKPGVADAEKQEAFKESMSLQEWQVTGMDRHSVSADPGFVDFEGGDYRLEDDSPAHALGFKEFPLDQFGVTSAVFQEIAAQGHALYDHPFGNVELAEDRDATPRRWFGATVKNVTTMEEVTASAIPGIGGVLLLTVPEGSPAAAAGFRVGDVILTATVDGWKKNQIRSFDDLLKLSDEFRGKKAEFGVDGNKPPRGVALKLEE